MDPLPHATALAISVILQLSYNDNILPSITEAISTADINSLLSFKEGTEFTKKRAAFFIEKMARHDAARTEFLETKTIQVLLETHSLLDSNGRLYTRDALRQLGRYEDTKQWLRQQDPSLQDEFTSFSGLKLTVDQDK